MFRNFYIVIVQLFLRCHSKAWGDDRQYICTQFLSFFAHADGISCGNTSRTSVYRNTAFYMVNGSFQNLDFLILIQNVTFSVGSKAEDSMYTAIDQTVNLCAQLIQIYALILIHWS